MASAVAYVMSDFAGVRVPEHKGGCGEQHTASADDHGYFRISCSQCAPALVGSHYGYAATPEGVPLTPDELAHRDHVKAQAEVGNAALDIQMRREFMRTHIPSLESQVATMSPAEKASLLAALTGGPEPSRRGRPKTAAARP